MKSHAFAFWMVSCIVVSLLVAVAIPQSDALGNVLTAVTSGLIGYLALGGARVIRPSQPRTRRRPTMGDNECICPNCRPDLYWDGGDDDSGSGYDGWMQRPDRPQPPYPYPPSRN